MCHHGFIVSQPVCPATGYVKSKIGREEMAICSKASLSVFAGLLLLQHGTHLQTFYIMVHTKHACMHAGEHPSAGIENKSYGTVWDIMVKRMVRCAAIGEGSCMLAMQQYQI